MTLFNPKAPMTDTPDDTPDLAALLGSRICHDLISPLGAIGNGVELLMMSGAAASPEVALIAESVASANARIRYFRVAFGSASPDQRMGRPEILSILAETTKGGRLTINWTPVGDVRRCEVKLAFLLLQCCESAMPYGGRIQVAAQDGGWRLTATALKFRMEPDFWDALANPGSGAEITPAKVHFALAPQELLRQDRRLVAQFRPTEIVLDC